MSTSMQQFKQQTFALIKEQATKLKTHSKQLQIKQQQVRFLKQTIQTLEQELNQSQRVKSNLKNKIDIIMKQVSNYNDNVIHKLHSENEMLFKKLNQLQPTLAQSLQTIKTLTSKLQESKQNIHKLSSEDKIHKQQAQKANKEIQKLSAQNTKLKQQITEHEKYVCKLQAQNQQLGEKIKSQEKQIDSVVSKCQQTVNNCQKKMKNLKDSLIKKEECVKLQQQLQKQIKKGEQLRKEKQCLLRDKNQLQLTMKIMKQKQVSNQMKNSLEKAVIQADLRCLKDFSKAGKKYNQFQSSYSNIMYDISQTMFQSTKGKQQAEGKLDQLQQKLSQSQRMLSQKQSLLEQSKNQLVLMAQKLKTESQTIQSSYQGKILQLSIKIKKQQKALHQLTIKDRQFESLNQQYDKLVQEHTLMKDTLQNTIFQYKKQNQKLSAEVEELIQLCDQNITTKNSLSCLKHSINNLLSVIYYLHLHLVRARESRRKVFQPFIDYYFKARLAIQNSKKSSNRKKGLRKLRACVVVVTAIKRMEKTAKQSNQTGLFRYADKSIKNKIKIQNLGEHLQNLLTKAIKFEKNVIDLLKQNKTVYRWNNLNNFLKVNLVTDWESNMLEQ